MVQTWHVQEGTEGLFGWMKENETWYLQVISSHTYYLARQLKVCDLIPSIIKSLSFLGNFIPLTLGGFQVPYLSGIKIDSSKP